MVIRQLKKVIFFVSLLVIIPGIALAVVKCPEPKDVRENNIGENWFALAGDPADAGKFMQAEIALGKLSCLYRWNMVLIYDSKKKPRPTDKELWTKEGKAYVCTESTEKCTVK